MNLAIDHHWWLLLTLVGLVSAIVGWRTMRGIPPFRRAMAIGARVLLFLVLGIAMSGVYRVEKADELAVIAVIDASASVNNFADLGTDSQGQRVTIDGAARGLLARGGGSRGPDDRMGLVAFDGRVQTIATPARSGVLDRAIEMPPVIGSDLAGAITRARAMVPPGSNGRLVVFSDGRPTTAGLDQIPDDIPIDVVPIRYNLTSEVVLESVELPARSLPGAVVDVRVVLRSLGASAGRVLLTYNGRAVDLNGDGEGTMARVTLGPGQQVLVYPVQLAPGRVHRFEARYLPDETGDGGYDGDTSTGNNRAGGVTMTSGEGRVLLVAQPNDDGTNPGDALVAALERTQWQIDTIQPPQFPADLLDLEGYDLVVLVNTPRDALDMEADGRLSAYVRDLGGGLIFVGGGEALSAGGWRESQIEPILPVKLDVADDLIVPQVAVVLVLDSSGSMRRTIMGSSRSQQEIANESAAGAIEILDPRDMVGVVSFESSAREVVPIGPNDQPASARARIESISSSGGTNIAPALKMAREMLESVEATAKHIVLLSDGESQNPELLPGMARELGQLGIKVSTIAVGDEADEQSMRQVAALSGGVYYRVSNPSVLPRIFLKAIRVVRTPMVREGRFEPIVLDAQSPATGTLGVLPPLWGLVITERIGDDPRVSTPIVSPNGEPVLAYHQVELGRVAAFTSDASRWARQWVGSPMFASFWGSLGAWAIRTGTDEPGELSMTLAGTSATIEYDAIDKDGAPIDGLDVGVQIFDSSGRSRRQELVQVGAGRYVGRADDLPSGVHVVIASPRQRGSPLPPTIAGLEVSGSTEFMHLSADPDAMIALASRTGGRVFELGGAEAPDLFSRQGLMVRRSLQPIWTALLVIAFALFVLDLAMRRVAFDRWVAQAREETVAVTRKARAEQMEQLFAARKQARAESIPAPEIDRSPMRRQEPEAEPARDMEVSGEESDNPLLAAKRRARSKRDEGQSVQRAATVRERFFDCGDRSLTVAARLVWKSDQLARQTQLVGTDDLGPDDLPDVVAGILGPVAGDIEEDDQVAVGPARELDALARLGLVAHRDGGAGRGTVDGDADHARAGLGVGAPFLVLVAAEPLDEDIELAADLLFGDRVGDPRLHGQQLVVAGTLDGIGDIVGDFVVGDGPGPWGVLEDEAVLVTRAFEHLFGQLVVLVGLGGEADDDVAAEHERAADLWLVQVLAHAVDEPVVFFDRVAPVHLPEHPVRAGLGRDMDVAADAGAIADHFQHIIAEVTRVAGDKAQTLDRGDLLVDAVEQVGEGGGVGSREGVAVVAALVGPPLLGLDHAVDLDGRVVLEAVVVDGLAQERDLDHARIGEHLDLVDDVPGRAVDLGPTGVGDDAVGAELVAAAGDADIGAASPVAVDG